MDDRLIKGMKMTCNPTSHTLPTNYCTKITRFPSGLRLHRLRNTSIKQGVVKVGYKAKTHSVVDNLSIAESIELMYSTMGLAKLKVWNSQ